jgi:hypothetical protein
VKEILTSESTTADPNELLKKTLGLIREKQRLDKQFDEFHQEQVKTNKRHQYRSASFLFFLFLLICVYLLFYGFVFFE